MAAVLFGAIHDNKTIAKKNFIFPAAVIVRVRSFVFIMLLRLAIANVRNPVSAYNMIGLKKIIPEKELKILI